MMKLCDPRIGSFLLKSQPKVPKFDDPKEEIRLNNEFQSNNIRVSLIPVISAAKMAIEGGGGIKPVS